MICHPCGLNLKSDDERGSDVKIVSETRVGNWLLAGCRMVRSVDNVNINVH